MEKAMAPHSSTLAWKIHGRRSLVGCSPWGRWVRHVWATSLSLFTFLHWRRKWQPTPVFLLGESQGRGSLVGCRLWGRTESDTTEATQQQRQSSLNISTTVRGFFFGCVQPVLSIHICVLSLASPESNFIFFISEGLFPGIKNKMFSLL